MPTRGAAADRSRDAACRCCGLALLGGLILNFMPCVLPVLSLKLLGAHRAARSSAARGAARLSRHRRSASCCPSWRSRVATIGLDAAGVAVGWGMQFQEPLFLAAMAALLTLFAANLWGFFEVPLPRACRRHRASAGALGNVATGAFATLLATPCSAPFLGTAVGFALAGGTGARSSRSSSRSASAWPRLICWSRRCRGWRALLPRPGRWMI